MIKEWKNKKLKLCTLKFNQGNNQCKTILRSISGIKFSQLKEIFIYRNSIESIEGFSRIYMPELKHASISIISTNPGFNQITSIRDFRKSHFPQLKRFGISKDLFKWRRQHHPRSLIPCRVEN